MRRKQMTLARNPEPATPPVPLRQKAAPKPKGGQVSTEIDKLYGLQQEIQDIVNILAAKVSTIAHDHAGLGQAGEESSEEQTRVEVAEKLHKLHSLLTGTKYCLESILHRIDL